MLFEEALADSKKLKEVAEQNAKNAIINAITPKIKTLIESQLLADGIENEEENILESTIDELSESDEIINEQKEKEYSLTKESISMLSNILKEENLTEKFELQMFRLHDRLQRTIMENSSLDKVSNLIAVKTNLDHLKEKLKNSKNSINETNYKKFNNNVDFMISSANKFINNELNEKIIKENFNNLLSKLKVLETNKSISREKKNSYAQKIFKEARAICDQVNKAEIKVSSKSQNELKENLDIIYKKLRSIKDEK